MKHGTTTGLTSFRHVMRALRELKIKPKTYFRRMGKFPGVYIEQLVAVKRKAFGAGPNPKVSVLLVPELRKRRSERDPVVLEAQIKNANNRLAAIRAGGQ